MDKQAADTQRVLWAVVAVSLLVIVVLAGGLYFLRPQGAEKTEVTVTYADQSPFDPFEYVRSDQETPGLLDAAEPVRQVTLVVGDSEPQSPSTASTEASAQQTRQTPAFPAPVKPAPARVATAPAPAPSATPERAATRPATPASVVAAPAPAPAPAPTPRVAGGLQYWVQVGSFSSRSRADDLHKLLRDLGYAGRITAHDADGVTMHRVRIGPSASRPEADRLLGKLRNTNDMDGWIAQVRGSG